MGPRIKCTARLLLYLACCGLLHAQSTSSPGQRIATPDSQKPLTFDVISIKPGKGDGSHVQLRFTPDGFQGTDISAHLLLVEAFGVDDDQVIGEPAWANKRGFDIQAKVDSADVSTLDQLSFNQRLRMFRQVLDDRFKLRIHHEARELPVYALRVAKDGPRVVPSPDFPNAAPISENGPGALHVSAGSISGQWTTMQYLAVVLSGELGRTVIDQTGLKGGYDFKLTWTKDEGEGGALKTSTASDPDASGPSLFTAIQEQLGLKLEPVKTAVDVIVVDHLEEPSEN